MHVQRLSPVGIAWCVVVVGIGATLGTIVGGLVVTAVQLAVPDVPGLDPTTRAPSLRPGSAQWPLALSSRPHRTAHGHRVEVVRGFLFVGLVLPLIVLLQGAWWQRGLLTGLPIAALLAAPLHASVRERTGSLERARAIAGEGLYG